MVEGNPFGDGALPGDGELSGWNDGAEGSGQSGGRTGAKVEINRPEAGGLVAVPMEDGLAVAGDGDGVGVKVGLTAVVAQEADGQEGAGFQGGEDVSEAGVGGKEWDVELSGVCGFDGGSIWETNVDRVRGCDGFEGADGAANHEIVAGGSGVGDGRY
jgi:hypothetical protein